jgi:hypothetical protein
LTMATKNVKSNFPRGKDLVREGVQRINDGKDNSFTPIRDGLSLRVRPSHLKHKYSRAFDD